MKNTSQSQKALHASSLHLGIIGGLAFIVFVLIFGKDWTHRYFYLLYLIPLPIVILWMARRFPFWSGLGLMIIGAGAFVFDLFFSPSFPGQVAGRGIGYTAVFVMLPLVISGISYLHLWNKQREHLAKNNSDRLDISSPPSSANLPLTK